MNKTILASQTMEQESALEMIGRITGKCRKASQITLPGLDQPIRIKDVLEIAGPENCGKTQLLYTAIVQCLIPVKHGGLGMGAVFIDSDLKFSGFRLINMMENYLSEQIEESGPRMSVSQIDLQPILRDSLSRFWKFSFEGNNEFVHVFDHVDKLLLENPSICLVCIDSISAFYWINRNSKAFDSEQVPGQLAQQQVIRRIAKFRSEHNVALVTTRLAIKWYNKPEEEEDAINGANHPGFSWRNVMDKSWQKMLTSSVVLSKQEDGEVVECFNLPSGATQYFSTSDSGACVLRL